MKQITHETNFYLNASPSSSSSRTWTAGWRRKGGAILPRSGVSTATCDGRGCGCPLQEEVFGCIRHLNKAAVNGGEMDLQVAEPSFDALEPGIQSSQLPLQHLKVPLLDVKEGLVLALYAGPSLPASSTSLSCEALSPCALHLLWPPGLLPPRSPCRQPPPPPAARFHLMRLDAEAGYVANKQLIKHMHIFGFV